MELEFEYELEIAHRLGCSKYGNGKNRILDFEVKFDDDLLEK